MYVSQQKCAVKSQLLIVCRLQKWIESWSLLLNKTSAQRWNDGRNNDLFVSGTPKVAISFLEEIEYLVSRNGRLSIVPRATLQSTTHILPRRSFYSSLPVFYHRQYFQETDKVKRQHSSLKTTGKEDYQDKAAGERKTRLQMIQPKKLTLQGQQEFHYRTQSRQRFVHQKSWLPPDQSSSTRFGWAFIQYIYLFLRWITW